MRKHIGFRGAEVLRECLVHCRWSINGNNEWICIFSIRPLKHVICFTSLIITTCDRGTGISDLLIKSLKLREVKQAAL